MCEKQKLLTINSLFIIFLTANLNLRAQGHFELSGTINDENGKPLNGATVFLSGTKKRTVSNKLGEFGFFNIDAGTFQLTVQMLGYAPIEQNIIISNKAINIRLSLTPKSIILKEVVIGNNDAWKKNYAIFKDQFLGLSNDNKCVILNPKVINFSTKKTFFNRIILNADADEFLNIENKQLGYRIKYLLKTFTYNAFTKITNYNGNAIFEEMEGSEEEKKIWIKNRLEAYNGSFMHFLRSVYAGTTLDEGFITRQLYKAKGVAGNLTADIAPIKFDTIVTKIDSSFIAMKFSSLYVIYDPGQAADIKASMINYSTEHLEKINNNIAETGSILSLHLNRAIIDQKGSFSDYRTFLIHGYWGGKRIGDQLPFEYQAAPQ